MFWPILKNLNSFARKSSPNSGITKHIGLNLYDWTINSYCENHLIEN